MKKRKTKEVSQKLAAGMMSGVMLLSSTGATTLAQEILPTDVLSGGDDTRQMQKGVALTAEQAAPTLASRTSTSVTLNSTDSLYYTAYKRDGGTAEVWKQASGGTIVFEGLEAGTAYSFQCSADSNGNNPSPAASYYTLQAAPSTPESCAAISYPEETITISPGYEMNTVSDFKGDPIKSGDVISAFIGKSLYIRAVKKGEIPEGEAAAYAIKSRPENTTAVPADRVTRTTSGFSFTPDALGVYQYTGGSQLIPKTINGGKVTGLQPGTTYNLISYTAATDEAFKSGTDSQELRTKSVVAPATKDGPGQSDSANTVKVDKNEADLGESITYTVSYAEGYTPSMTIGGTELSIDAAQVDPENRTAVFSYTVKESDTTINAVVHFNNRSVKAADTLGAKTLYANDAANTSAEALAASLDSKVRVTYDNKTTGEVDAHWQMKKGQTFKIKGGEYTYEALLGDVTATQALRVLAVNATFEALKDEKLPVKSGGYTMADLGLKDTLEVTYSGTGFETMTDNAAVNWSPSVPANFGAKQTDRQVFTGTVAIPEWATVNSTVVSREITFGTPVKVEGLVLYSKAYDGTTVANWNKDGLSFMTLLCDGSPLEGYTLSGSSPVIHLDSANVGKRTIASVEDLSISGPEADKYVLDFSGLSTTITKQVNVAAPGKPTVVPASVTDTSAEVSVADPADGYRLEYACAEDSQAPAVWQTSGTFIGLKPGTSYQFYARYAESSNNAASPASQASDAVKTDAQVSEPTKAGAGKNDAGCTITASTTHAKAGEKVTYTVKPSENYTVAEADGLKVNGQAVALTKGAQDPTGVSTYTADYMVTDQDTVIKAEASFSSRTISTVTAPTAVTMNANDPKNASQQALEQSLPQTVQVVYDNGASGEESVQWVLDESSSWDIKGGTYAYNGTLVSSPAKTTTMSVTVDKVTATMPVIAAKTIAIRDEAYTMEELGLGSTVKVTFDQSVDAMDCPVSWNPQSPGDFGTKGGSAAEKTFTGMVTLPDWATVSGAAEVTAEYKTAAPLTVMGITVKPKAYDGTKTAELDLTSAALVGAAAGADVSFNKSASLTAEFEDASVGANKTVNVTGNALSGADADKYIIDWAASKLMGEITKASVSAAPAAPVVDVSQTTSTRIALKPVEITDPTALAAGAKAQYSQDKINWQTSPVFTGLEPGTAYTFYARVGATGNTNASDASAASASESTKVAVIAPVLDVFGDCAAGQGCSIELYDAANKKITSLLEAAAGDKVTYKITYCDAHTMHFTFKGQELALSETTEGMKKARDQKRTWYYEYTVQPGDKTVTASAEAAEKSVKEITAEPIIMAANDVRNQSLENIEKALPKFVQFEYDNGTEGTDSIKSWSLKNGEWDIKGSDLTYVGTLTNNTKAKVTQVVKVEPVTAEIETTVGKITIKEKPEGYTLAELESEGLPTTASIRYDNYVDTRDKTAAIIWQLPEDFGKVAKDPAEITGKAVLPEWATAATDVMQASFTVTARQQAKLIIDPADITKVYDGSTVIENVPVRLDESTLDADHKKVALSGETATVRFQTPNVGTGLYYSVEGLTLTGEDEAWYSLTSNYKDGVITQAQIEAPGAPSVADISLKSITLKPVELDGPAKASGAKVIYQISSNNGKNYGDNADKYSPVFKNLDPGKAYSFRAIVEATANTEASEPGMALEVRTKFNPVLPIIAKTSPCAGDAECQIEMTDAQGRTITEKSEVGAGDVIHYTVTSCDHHTPGRLLINSKTEVALSGTDKVRTGAYTITSEDSQLISQITFNDRQAVRVESPDPIEMYANDDRNQSADDLAGCLPKEVAVIYDNGTQGAEAISKWNPSGMTWNPRGGDYIYVAAVGAGGQFFALQNVTVKPVSAAYEPFADTTLPTRETPYTWQELGLLDTIAVTYTSEDGTIKETKDEPLVWTPDVPEDFGTAEATQTFTAKLALPAYAGGEKVLTKTVRVSEKSALVIRGVKAQDKVYDGTADAVLDFSQATFTGDPGFGSYTVDWDQATGAFEDANAGDSKKVTVEGIVLSGQDADHYILSVEQVSASIKKAEITGVVFENARFPEDGATHSLKAVYPEDCGITGVSYTYEKDGVKTTEAPKAAGTYTVTASFTVDDNHQAKAPMTATMVIGEAGGTVEDPVVEGLPEGVTGCTVTADKDHVTEAGEAVTYTVTRNQDRKSYVPAVMTVNGQALTLTYDRAAGSYQAVYVAEDPTVSVTATVQYVLLGSFNGDSTINIIDAQQIAQAVAAGQTPSAVQKAAGDVNFDNKVNIIDAQQIAQYTADPEKKF
ncbi:YDG domain-containing protein [Eubacterium maltosivorans]|uniref:YDG domain-containing protein n=1 Tax=Eubacterium maltosivorans TaxID=2041044 RepID=UPI00189C5B43|nr:YDG domain-containing protein [Eubacterium maltosivorans]